GRGGPEADDGGGGGADHQKLAHSVFIQRAAPAALAVIDRRGPASKSWLIAGRPIKSASSWEGKGVPLSGSRHQAAGTALDAAVGLPTLLPAACCLLPAACCLLPHLSHSPGSTGRSSRRRSKPISPSARPRACPS